uniref:Uncharacterized protein n=1 Tax=Chromera velia CCMP2878 TaxID=1169474 RepID=A0A0G4I9D0_9ALVE|eukprot:Cvel_2035.t1-p1 / transcript=Cvel_2035.t1 / gene=Cvel_2035 / organism=Chromera_velia_CCMP2878 / gene_product=hypothetical protein / transcript_product=hypothetical protein / location=Cvel_scaffold78:23489-26034(+) / protein_length=515 / sequence_SO=supercontig / SO=protein_coding / is_pseudo=false
MRNADGIPVTNGNPHSFFGGDTGIPPGALFYCGRANRPCRCRKCPHDTCGPKEGCPCKACLTLMGFRLNRAGVVCKPGGRKGDGGDQKVKPHRLFYCGRTMGQCRCGECDGRCGPADGCPCSDCLAVLDMSKMPQKDPFAHGMPGPPGPDRHPQAFDGRISPQAIPPPHRQREKAPEGPPMEPVSSPIKEAPRVNAEGVEAWRGKSHGPGGDTGLPASQLFYCGRWMDECGCGECRGQCGPASGCPCSDCLMLIGPKAAEILAGRRARATRKRSTRVWEVGAALCSGGVPRARTPSPNRQRQVEKMFDSLPNYYQGGGDTPAARAGAGPAPSFPTPKAVSAPKQTPDLSWRWNAEPPSPPPPPSVYHHQGGAETPKGAAIGKQPSPHLPPPPAKTNAGKSDPSRSHRRSVTWGGGNGVGGPSGVSSSGGKGDKGKGNVDEYESLLASVVLEGGSRKRKKKFVTSEEAQRLENSRKKKGISEQLHWVMLEMLGVSPTEYEQMCSVGRRMEKLSGKA